MAGASSNGSQEYIAVVNKYDKVTGVETLEDVHENGNLHRHSLLVLINENNEMLLQQGLNDKLTFSSGGHPRWKESYPETIIREGMEELGRDFESLNLKEIGRIRLDYGSRRLGGYNNGFFKLYGARTNLEIENYKIDKLEVNSIIYTPVHVVNDLVVKRPTFFANSFREVFKRYKKEICNI